MANGTVIAEYGSIKIQHFSTSSLVKIIIEKDKDVLSEEWFEYSEIKDLYSSLKQLEENYKWLIIHKTN